ncbi:MAG TPA: ricin-type beta-trefoil lectin domain protein [Steroidobacteraceae bacterium]|nr:ricin-type beta-trefoil lectin domain protein [Steroidobacteraceae bacterium]
MNRPANADALERVMWAAVILLLLLDLAACASGKMIVGANTNECVNVPWHGYPIDGTQVRLLYCRGHQNQYWNIADGQITGVGGSCLDVQGGAPVDGAQVIYVACNGSPSQHWSVANGQIVGIGGKCLDIEGGNENDRAPLIITPCTGAPSQQWEVH